VLHIKSKMGVVAYCYSINFTVNHLLQFLLKSVNIVLLGTCM